MARQRSYGDMLREARERKGMDLYAVSRRLRIRPDILRAIEEADFPRLPARGYTRNMINAYARLLGVDPREATSRYLDEIHLFETGRPRSESSRDRNGARRSSGERSRTRGRDEMQQRSSRRPRRETQAPEHMTRRDRSHRTSPERTSRSMASGTMFPSLYSSANQSPRQQTAFGGPKLAIVVAGIVVVLLVVIIAVVVFGGDKPQAEDVPNVPISGLTDTSNPTSDDGSTDAQAAATPPESVKVTYKIADGKEVYAEITQDGDTDSKMFTGPVEETVEVSGTWTFATWVEDAVTVTVDDEEVPFDTDTGGMPECTVDFDDYLDQWYEDHPDVARSSSCSSSSSSSSSDDSSSKSDSSSGSSSDEE